MYTTTLPITLVLAGGLALIHLWLTFRVGQVRRAEGVYVGDGGSERVLRRMRAHSNFAENAPLAAILTGFIELAAGASIWLWAIAALFLLARALHPLGMDGWKPGRMFGAAASAIVLLLLATWAISIPITGAYSPVIKDVDPVTARG